jgi:2-oxoisovalerate dehydrogenase E1 component alpha subunit
MTDYAPLSLHVPEPAVRPGGTPDFSSVRVPEAGSVVRPRVDADPESIRDLAYSVIRVLDRDGEAVGPWGGLLNDDELLEGLRHMMILRTFDARMVMAQRQGKTSFYMQHMGEEAVSCGVRKALQPGDMNFPTYRQAGLLIAAGHSLEDMMCQIYSNERDPLKGRQTRHRARWRPRSSQVKTAAGTSVAFRRFLYGS